MDDSFQKRLDALDQKLKAVEARRAEAEKPSEAVQKFNGMGLAYRMVIDLCAGVVFGFVVGRGIDWFFSTTPWGMIIMILLGLAAGIRIMLQTAQRYEAESRLEKEETKDDK